LGCSTLYLDAPFRYDNEAVKYFARQLRDQLIPFLEDVTKAKFDLDKFREIMAEANKAYELLVEITDLIAHKPAPFTPGLRQFHHGSYFGRAGYPEFTKILEDIYILGKKKIASGKPRESFSEKLRILWGHIPPTFDPTLFTWLEEEFGATYLCNILSGSPMFEPVDTKDLDAILESLAWQGLDMTMSLMRWDSKKYVDYTVKLFDRFQCDCYITTLHPGCPTGCGSRGLITDALRSRDIPALFLEYDFLDDRVASRESVRDQLEEFFETVMEV
jgi:benzoyl-CoA reductase/2-hydroxyglutaryl-CoA dehydratase subunit BcrC/BadD/HgdB